MKILTLVGMHVVGYPTHPSIKKHDRVVLIIGIALVLAGVIGAAGAASADYTGLNLTQDNKDFKEFGWMQMVACGVGVLLLIAGVVMVVLSLVLKGHDEEQAQGPAEAAPLVVQPQFQERRAMAQYQVQTPPAQAPLSRQVPVRGPPQKAPTPQAQTVTQAGAASMPIQNTPMGQGPRGTATIPTQGQTEALDVHLPDESMLASMQPQEDADYPTLTTAPEDEMEALDRELEMDMSSQFECPECGDPIEPGSKTCGTCGAPLGEKKGT